MLYNRKSKSLVIPASAADLNTMATGIIKLMRSACKCTDGDIDPEAIYAGLEVLEYLLPSEEQYRLIMNENNSDLNAI